MADVEAEIERYRALYPDLTAAEEGMIRDGINGGLLFFRCRFDNNDIAGITIPAPRPPTRA